MLTKQGSTIVKVMRSYKLTSSCTFKKWTVEYSRSKVTLAVFGGDALASAVTQDRTLLVS